MSLNQGRKKNQNSERCTKIVDAFQNTLRQVVSKQRGEVSQNFAGEPRPKNGYENHRSKITKRKIRDG